MRRRRNRAGGPKKHRRAGEAVLNDNEIEKALASLVAEGGPHPPAAGGVLVGLLGRGIGQSRSPAMHEREGARLGLSYRYVRIDFDRLDLRDEDVAAVVAAARRLGFKGLNVTHPLKQRVIACLDRVAPEAAAIGSVNTVVMLGAETVGHNTDGWGFSESLRKAMPGRPLGRVVLFGAGGAGAAVAHALLERAVDALAIVDLSKARAQALADRLAPGAGPPVEVAEDVARTVAAADGIVNATPVGMDKYPGTPLPVDMLRPRQWVADIVYFPVETELLRAARALGCTVVPGTGMAINQAVRAFELFTGIRPDPTAMSAHFEAAPTC